MSVAKVSEITSSSDKSFEDAIQTGITRASKTLENIQGAWINEQTVVVKNGKVADISLQPKDSIHTKAAPTSHGHLFFPSPASRPFK